MTADLPLPLIKNPEPLPVPSLQAVFFNAGIDVKEGEMLWLGNDESAQRYRLIQATGESLEIKMVAFISEEEKIIFRAFQDWFAAAIRKVSDAVRGYYTFEVLQFEVGDAPWSWSEFSLLLIAHAKKLGVGERQLIQFGALWGVLHKRTEADFGRVESKLALHFCKPSIEALTRFIKKQCSQSPLASNLWIAFRDLSRTAFCPAQADFELLATEIRLKNAAALSSGNTFYWHPGSKLCLRA